VKAYCTETGSDQAMKFQCCFPSNYSCIELLRILGVCW